MPIEDNPSYAQAKIGIFGDFLPDNPGQTPYLVPRVSSLPVHPDCSVQLTPSTPAILPTPPEDFQRPTASLNRPSKRPTLASVGLLGNGIGYQVPKNSPTNRSIDCIGPHRKRRQDWCHWQVCQEFFRTGKCGFSERKKSAETNVTVGGDKEGITSSLYKEDTKQRGGEGGEARSERKIIEVVSEDRGVSKCQVKGDEGEGVIECMAAHIKPSEGILLTRDGDVRVCFDSMGLTQSDCTRKKCHFYHPTEAIRAKIVAKRHTQYLKEKELIYKDTNIPERKRRRVNPLAITSSGLLVDDRGMSIKQPRLSQTHSLALASTHMLPTSLTQNFTQSSNSTTSLRPSLIFPPAVTQPITRFESVRPAIISAPSRLPTLVPTLQSTPLLTHQPTPPIGLEGLLYNQEISNCFALLQQNQQLLAALLSTGNQPSLLPSPAYQQHPLGVLDNSLSALNSLLFPISNSLTMAPSTGVHAPHLSMDVINRSSQLLGPSLPNLFSNHQLNVAQLPMTNLAPIVQPPTAWQPSSADVTIGVNSTQAGSGLLDGGHLMGTSSAHTSFHF